MTKLPIKGNYASSSHWLLPLIFSIGVVALVGLVNWPIIVAISAAADHHTLSAGVRYGMLVGLPLMNLAIAILAGGAIGRSNRLNSVTSLSSIFADFGPSKRMPRNG